MALNFPNSPTIGQIYTDTTSGFSYEWDGTVWKSYSPASASNIKILDDVSGSFNGSTQSFALTSGGVSLNPVSSQSLIVVLGGVVQEPGADYTLVGSNIFFTTAPDAGLSFSGVSLGPAVPITYANDGNIYIRNTYTGAGTTGPFSFPQGYTVGYLDVYRNGVRLSSGSDFVGTSGTNFFLTDAATVGDELEAIGYTVTALVQATSNLDNLNVTGITTTGRLQVTTNANIGGIVTASSFVGNLTGTASTATNAQGLTGSPNITVGNISASNVTGSAATFTNLTVNGTQTIINTTSLEVADKTVGIASTSTPSDALADGAGVVVYGTTNKTLLYDNTRKGWDFNIPLTTDEVRFYNVAEKFTRVDGNTVNLVYSANGSNIGFATNPTGNITVNVTGIPTTSDFDNHIITFTVFVNNTGTARSCTAINFNGVSETINWAGGSLAAATAGVTTSNGMDIYSFTGINTVGSASTTANYYVLGVVNGGYR